MGGTSQTTQQTSQKTEPWAPAKPALTGILDKLNPLISNSGLSSTATGALDTMQANVAQGNPYSPQINDFVKNLLSGGGASNQSGAVSSGFNDFKSRLTPYASGSMVGNNPALQAQLDTIMSDVGNSINSQFAAAGRDMSGANQQAYGRGVAQGIAPVLANQYNQDVSNQLNAANMLYQGGNTTAGLLSGMNQQGLSNQLQGVTSSQDALAADNYAASKTLDIERLRQAIPAEQLGLLAQIGIPIAQLGGTSTGTATGTNQMSGAQQFGLISGGLGGIGKFMWG